MKKISLILVILLSLSVSSFGQYFTKTQIITINSSNQAFEGDVYIDSVNKDYYIGHSDGGLSQINQSLDSVVFLANSDFVFYWNFKEKDTIDFHL